MSGGTAPSEAAGTRAADPQVETALPLARKAAAVLEAKGIGNARLEAELMLAAVLGLKRLDLYLQHDRPVADAELESYRQAVRRRLRREPVQYIVGSVAFRALELAVDRRVLIPRPETEVLVGVVLGWLASHPSARSALDIGTGSGAIALSLAREAALARIVATDVSGGALEVAAANAARHDLVATDVSGGALEVAAANAARNGLAASDAEDSSSRTGSSRIEFRQGALWSPIAPGERFDVIASNPPYVADPERDTLAPEVREWEPEEALFAGADGLAVIAPLVSGARDRLVPGGLLALEVGAGQGAAVAALAESAGLIEVRVHRDLSGRDRIVTAAARPHE